MGSRLKYLGYWVTDDLKDNMDNMDSRSLSVNHSTRADCGLSLHRRHTATCVSNITMYLGCFWDCHGVAVRLACSRSFRLMGFAATMRKRCAYPGNVFRTIPFIRETKGVCGMRLPDNRPHRRPRTSNRPYRGGELLL